MLRSNERNKLIKQYYDACGSEMTYEDFEKICKTPFIHARRQIVSGKLPEIRLMYLGKFKVYPSRVIQMLTYSKKRYDKLLITKQQYDEYVNILITFVRTNSDDFKKLKEKLKEWIYL